MGKGDKKTKRGKISMGSYGVRRSRAKYKSKNHTGGAATAEKPKKATPKKTETKKPAAKKVASKKAKEKE